MDRAVDVLDELILFVGVDSMKRQPGALVKRLPEAKRDILKTLTSDDALKMRPFWK